MVKVWPPSSQQTGEWPPASQIGRIRQDRVAEMSVAPSRGTDDHHRRRHLRHDCTDPPGQRHTVPFDQRLVATEPAASPAGEHGAEQSLLQSVPLALHA